MFCYCGRCYHLKVIKFTPIGVQMQNFCDVHNIAHECQIIGCSADHDSTSFSRSAKHGTHHRCPAKSVLQPFSRWSFTELQLELMHLFKRQHYFCAYLPFQFEFLNEFFSNIVYISPLQTERIIGLRKELNTFHNLLKLHLIGFYENVALSSGVM